MKIHYFQRYHGKENVATANTMLLLSRLYSYSSDKFFRLLKTAFFSDLFEPEIIFNLQEKSKNSVPDATITQESFKIVVETKMSDWFYEDQLIKHLSSFSDEKYKVMITLAPEPMEAKKKEAFEEKLKEYNSTLNHPILHVNTVFERLIEAIREVIDDRDYEMLEVLDDYIDYCNYDNLILGSNSWRKLRVQLAGSTFDFNLKENLYYDSITRNFSPHDYLGLYKEKSVRAIGKISAIITAVKTSGEMMYNVEKGILTEDKKLKIEHAIKDGKNYGYSLDANRYFFVEKFYETDYKKVTPRAPMGSRIFDLVEVLNNEKLPETNEIAILLSRKTWN